VFTVSEHTFKAEPTPQSPEPSPVTDTTNTSGPKHPRRTTQSKDRSAANSLHAKDIFGFERDSKKPSFPALRIVARSYEVLAVIVIVVAAIMFAAMATRVIFNPEDIFAVILASGLTFLWTVATAITLLFFAQGIRLGLQVEQNTRETSVACRQLAEHLCAIESVD
jgi:hypothetical protein